MSPRLSTCLHLRASEDAPRIAGFILVGICLVLVSASALAATPLDGVDATDPHFTGNADSGQAGTISKQFQIRFIAAVNYVRAAAGSPPVVFNSQFAADEQRGALINSAYTGGDGLTHFPTPANQYYTVGGADACEKSNLAGASGIDSLPSEFIVGWLADAGHAIMMLNPQLADTAVGYIPTSTKKRQQVALLRVQANYNPAAVSEYGYTSVPLPGHIPQDWMSYNGLFFPSDRSSDLSAATVAITVNNKAVSTDSLEVRAAFNGSYLSYVFGPEADIFAPGDVITITVSNVVVGGVPKTYNYTTVVIPAGVDVAGSTSSKIKIRGHKSIKANSSAEFKLSLVRNPKKTKVVLYHKSGAQWVKGQTLRVHTTDKRETVTVKVVSKGQYYLQAMEKVGGKTLEGVKYKFRVY